MTVRAIGLVLHPTRDVEQSVGTIVRSAGEHRVLARVTDAGRVPDGVEVLTDEHFRAQADGVIALGGDGTMLGAMRLVVDRPVPVLGVNHGHLGFLVEVSPGGLASALKRLSAGDYSIEPHDCLDVRAPALTTAIGFNDVVLSRSGRGGAVSVDLSINDQQYGYYRCDAVVVATPTGSTAYNYAAGGPVLSPSSRSMVITPVAPMSGISRAIVLGADDAVSLTVADESALIAVDVDGTAAGELQPGAGLVATTRRNAAQVVRLSAAEHASRSRVKLSLLDLPLRRDQLLDLIPPELRRRAF